MNRAHPLLSALAAGAVLHAGALAQTPVDPPPWWGLADLKCVSLYWSFDQPFAPGTFPPPTLTRAPAWYTPSVTAGVVTPNVRQVPGLGTGGAIGLLGSGTPQTASIDLTVDNDPYVDWIKIFWFQYDELEGSSGGVKAVIEQSLQYERAIVAETSVPLGGGWNRVTIQAQLIPQPDDEGIDWALFENGTATVAIDNLFVSSKCVKPGPDATGDALGDVDQRVPLWPQLTAGDYRGAAITEGPPPAFAQSYWVADRSSATAPHVLKRFARNAPFPVLAVIPLAANSTTVPQGPGDLAVETRTSPTGVVTQNVVWVVLDERPSNGPVRLQGVDAATGVSTFVTLQFPPLAVVPANQVLGLAFDPTGDPDPNGVAQGSFWVAATDNNGLGQLREFGRSGAALGPVRPIPAFTHGLGYDDALGRFYGLSAEQQPTPTQPVRVNGWELSAYDFALTGVRFCGDLTLANGTAGPRGGTAAGLECFRSRAVPLPTPQLTLVCAADVPNNATSPQWLYELAAPFGFGTSVLGRCGLRATGPFNGVPFVGSTFEVTLTGVPDTLFASLFLGFSNQNASGLGPLPVPLGSLLGWPESVLSVSPDVNTPLLQPSSPGTFSFAIAVPPVAALGYRPVFFQWLALDAGVPGFFAMSQAGKTVLYP
jgi:hypothetical protein